MATAEYDSKALSLKIQSTYSKKVSNISSENPIYDLFSVNIPKTSFVKTEPKSWEDLKPYSTSCQVLQTLCSALSVSSIKTDEQESAGNVLSSPFYNNMIPKISIFIEILVSSTEFENDIDLYDQDNVIGYRLWFYFRDEIDLNGSVENAYMKAKTIQEKKEQRSIKKYTTNVFERSQEFKFFFQELYRNITGKELHSEFNFFDVFNSEKCIKGTPYDVSEKQRTLSTYFDTGLGCSANSLITELQLPRLFINVNISCFSELLKVPLPRFEILRALDLLNQKEELEILIETEKGIVETLRDQLTDENKHIFDEHCEKLQHYTSSSTNIDSEIEAYILMSFNNKNETDSLSVLEKIRKYDPLVELRYQGTLMYSDLNSSRKDMTYTQWSKEKKRIQEKLFKKWEITIMNEDNPLPLKNAYKTIRSTTLKQRYNTYGNMSVFGNYIINIASVATEYLTIHPNLRPFLLLYTVHQDCYRFTTGLRSNAFLIGPPGAGKTEMVNRIACISADGTFNTTSHQSEMSTFVPGPSPYNFSTVFRDEVTNRTLGIDPYGRPEESEQYSRFKDFLTNAIRNSDVFQEVEENGRKVRGHGKHTAWNTYNVILSSNTPSELSKTSPIGSRVPPVPINSSVENSEYKVSDRIYQEKKTTPEALEQFKQHQLDENIHMLIESMITGYVIEKPNLLLAKWILRLVFDYLEKYDINHPTERLTNFYMNTCRSLTIRKAINFLFRSEYSLKYGQGRGVFDKFNFKSLLDVEPHLFCDTEIPILVLAMIRDQLMDVTGSKLVNGIAKKILPHWPVQGKNDKTIKFRIIESEEDYNQICINGSNYDVILKTIQSALGNSISSEELHHAIVDLKIKPVTSNMKMEYRFKDEKYNEPEDIMLDEGGCFNCGEIDDSKLHNCYCGKKLCVPISRTCSMKCIECSELIHIDCPESWKCDMCNLVMHKKCRFRHCDLVRTNIITRRIPVIEIVTDRITNQVCLYLATSEIGNDPVTIFNEAIKNLSHKYMSKDEKTFITSNYIETNIPTVLNNGPYTIYDLFDTVTLKKEEGKDRVHVIKNYEKTSDHIGRVLFDNKVGKEEVDETEDVDFTIEDDFDIIAAKERLTEIGDLSRLESEMSLLIPDNQREYISQLRRKYDNIFNDNSKSIYPKDAVEEKIKNILLLKKTESRIRPPYDSTPVNKKFKKDDTTSDTIINNANRLFTIGAKITIPDDYKIVKNAKTKTKISSTDIFN